MGIELPHPLACAARTRPEHVLLVADAGEWTARRMADEVARRAAALLAGGVSAHDIVAVVGPPSAETVLNLWAVGWLGACALPIAATTPVAEIAARIELARAGFGVGPAALLPRGLCQPLLADHNGDATDSNGSSGNNNNSNGSGESYGGGDANRSRRLAPERDWPLEEPRFALTTSGSTGAPKLVTLTTAQIVFSAFGSLVRLGHSPADRWLACLSLEHVGGLSMLLRGLLAGVTVELHGTFAADRVAQTLDSGRITLVSLVPALLARVLDARPATAFPPELRVILLGGAPLGEGLRQRCLALRLPVATTWGMTESASQISTTFAGELDGTCGAALPFTHVDVTDDGALRVRGPTVGGTLVTADAGTLTDGRVRVLGRRDAMINCGGSKIDPRRLEAVLVAHPSVAEALVVGLADATLGEIPAALLVARNNLHPSDAELTAHCDKTLSRGCRPRRYQWVENLPLGSTGKPSPRLAREILLAHGAAVPGMR